MVKRIRFMGNKDMYGKPRDCTRCYYYRKPVLSDPEGIRYHCQKDYYMPDWSKKYAVRGKFVCPDYTEYKGENNEIIIPRHG